MKYKAIVRDKQDNQVLIIERDYPTKTEFIKDLRANGFAVNRDKVKESKLFDYILENTNGEERHWRNTKI